ncbi:MAG TPA: hypothetical protein DCK97_04430, partial [Tistrella mobilis]|nr:hypothetical protein [Tistrella mobilis]
MWRPRRRVACHATKRAPILRIAHPSRQFPGSLPQSRSHQRCAPAPRRRAHAGPEHVGPGRNGLDQYNDRRGSRRAGVAGLLARASPR